MTLMSESVDLELVTHYVHTCFSFPGFLALREQAIAAVIAAKTRHRDCSFQSRLVCFDALRFTLYAQTGPDQDGIPSNSYVDDVLKA